MLAAAGDENSHDDNKEQENRRWPIQHKLTSEMTSPVGNTPRYLYAITEAKREGTQSNLGQMMPVHNTAEA